MSKTGKTRSRQASGTTKRHGSPNGVRLTGELFETLIRHFSDAVSIVSVDGTFLYESPSIEGVLGYTPDEMVGRNMAELVHPDDLQVVAETFVEAASSGYGATASATIRFLHKNGSWIVVEGTGVNLLDDPAVKGIVVNYRDVTHRVLADWALKESEERYRALIENASEAILVAQDGEIKFHNSRLTEVTGYSSQEIESATFADFIHPEDRQMVVERHLMRLAGEDVPNSYRFRVINKDGAVRWIELYAVRADWEGRPAVLNHLRDITERLQAEESIKESEENYRDLVERANDGIAIIQDGLVAYANPALVAMLGYSLEEAIGTSMANYAHPDELPIVIDRYKRRMAGENVAPVYESVLLHKDGHGVEVEANAGVVTYEGRPADMIMFRDITERKRAEEELERSEKYYRALIDNALDSTVVLGGDGTILYESPNFRQLTGESREGKDPFEFVHPEDAAHSAESFAKLLAEPGGTLHTEVRGRRTDGSWRYLEVLGHNLMDDPAVAGLVVSMRDITERKRAEEAIQRKLAVEQAISQISAHFVGVLDVDEAIEHSLADFGRLTGASRAFFYQLLDDGGAWKLLHEWCAEGIDPHIAQARRLPSHLLSWWTKKLSKSKVVVVRDRSKLPKTAIVEKRGLEALDVKSLVALPVKVKGELAGFLGLHDPTETALWEHDDLALLRVVSEMVGNALERKRAQEELQASEERFRLIAENASDVIWTMDPDANFTYISPSIQQVSGYTPEEAMELGLRVLATDESFELAKKAFQNGLTRAVDSREEGPRPVTLELEQKRKDGTVGWAEVKVAVIRDQDGKPISVQGVTRDVTERKAAEEALRRSEEYFKALTENIVDVIVVLNGDGTIRYKSDSFERMAGRKRSGRSPLEFVHPSDTSKATKAFANLMKNPGGSVRMEIRGQHRDGSWRHFEVIGKNMLDNPAVGGIVANFRDVTERKESERQLQESEESFRTIFDSAAYGILLADMDTRRFHMANRTISEMIGYDRDELYQLDVASIHPEEALPFVLEQFEKQTRGEITTARSLPVKRKDGSVFYADITSASITVLGKTYLMGIFSDITDRKEAEQALRDSEARYRMLADNVTDSIWTMDMDLHLTYSSPAFTKLTGYTLEEVQDLTIGQILTPPSIESITSRILDVFAQEQSGELDPSEVLTTEVELYCKDGSTVWTETSARFLHDENGQAIGMLGVSRNITERKRVEEERQRMEQQLLQSGRLAAVGELAAGVAHELNNPLAAVQGYAQFLTTKQDLDETIRQDVETIYREAQRASRITANLLSFSRRHEPERKPISVNDCIEKSLELHAYRMKVNNIEISTELQANLPMTMADFYQLQQVFVNIITNAEQAITESNGRGKLEVTSRLSGDMIQVHFSDDGPGMPEEVMSRAFDPFFTTKDVGKGTGLGLSICYGLIEQHGGHIRAGSSPGKGTTIVVEIPVISEKQDSAQQTDRTRRASA